MPILASRSLVRRLVVSFAIAFLAFTSVMIALSVRRELPRLGHGVSAGTIANLVLLSVPFIAAMTIPMAVFVGVLWTYSRSGSERGIETARKERGGLWQLLSPAIGFATSVAALMVIWNAELLPPVNERLVTVIAAGTPAKGDRTMTIGELRTAAQEARTSTNISAARRVARYEIELQKKFSLAMACVALALAAAVIGIRFSRGGTLLVVGVSIIVFGAYYVCIITGEMLANRLVISPVLAMWTPNALLVLAALVVARRRGGPGAAPDRVLPIPPRTDGGSDARTNSTPFALALR